MPKYLIFPRKIDDPKIHASGSLEATACEIIHKNFQLSDKAESLQAVPESGAVATMVRVKGETYCSIEMTKKKQKIWDQVIPDIERALDEASETYAIVEDDIYRSMSDLNDSLAASKSFSGVVSGNNISVWITVGGCTLEEIDDSFRDKINTIYKLEKFN